MSVPAEAMQPDGSGPEGIPFNQIGAAADQAFNDAIDNGMPPVDAFSAAESAAQSAAEGLGMDWSTMEPAIDAGHQAFDDSMANDADPQEAWDSAGEAVQTAVGAQSTFEACGDAVFSTYEEALEGGATPGDAFASALESGQAMAESAGMDPNFVQGVVDAANAAWEEQQPVTDPMAAMQACCTFHTSLKVNILSKTIYVLI